MCYKGLISIVNVQLKLNKNLKPACKRFVRVFKFLLDWTLAVHLFSAITQLGEFGGFVIKDLEYLITRWNMFFPFGIS